MEAFQLAVKYIITDETGEEAHNDPSRKTRVYGLTAANCKEFTGKEIEEIVEEDIIRGYKNIWDVFSGDDLSPPLAYYMLDLSVRFDPIVAQRWFRLSLGLDILAHKSQVKAKLESITTRDIIVLMEVYVRRRLKSEQRWNECKHWWTNRANRVRDRAVKWSRELV